MNNFRFTSSVLTTGFFLGLISSCAESRPRLSPISPPEDHRIEPYPTLRKVFSTSGLLKLSPFQDFQKFKKTERLTLQNLYEWGVELGRAQGTKILKEEVTTIFNERDLNLDGEITETEWKKGYSFSPSANYKIFKFSNVDSDHDGSISFPEFVQWARDFSRILHEEILDTDEYIRALFRTKDRDSNGVLLKDEWLETSEAYENP